MHVERRIFANTAVLGIGEVVGQLANFGFVVLLARRYGVEVLGWYSFSMALGTVLAPFVSLGGSAYALREMARDRDRTGALFAALRPVQLASGLAVWLAMALIALAADIDRREALVMVIVGAYHVLLRMAALYLAPAAARERLLSTAIVGGGHRILLAVLAVALIMLGFDVPVALLAMPVAAAVSLAAARMSARADLQAPRSMIEAVDRAALLRASLPFLVTALLVVIYTRGGVLLLTALRGEAATGMFAAADRLLVPIYMVTGTFAMAVYPSLMRLAGEPDRMRELGRRCLRLILVMTITLSAVLSIFANDLTTIVFGTGLRDAAPVLALLAPLAVLRGVSSLWMGQCIALGEEHRAVIVRSWVLLAYFILAMVAIVAWGAAGLAVATVLCEALLAAGLRRVLAEHSQHQPMWQVVRGPVAAAACASVAAMLMPSLTLPIRLAVVAGIMILVMVLLGGIRGHDLRYLTAIVRGDARHRSPRGSRASPTDFGVDVE